MHIITGMLIAGLLGKGKAASLLPMLQSGPVQTDHAIRGRVRFRVPSLSGNRSDADLLRGKLPKLQGVESVDVNPATGSVLVRYRENQVRPDLLFAAIVRLLGLEEELTQTPPPTVVKELRSMMDSLNRVVHDRTGGLLDFSSALLIALAAAGMTKMFVDGKKAMPAGFTMLWWGLHQLLGHGEE
jgi:copper chaperone CopZ